MLYVNPDSYYTMEDLTEGLKFSSESSNPRLPFCKPGKIRCYKGSDLIKFIDHHTFYGKKTH